jgi:hypothetical protein
MPAAYQPKVEGELDTQNFESFDEDVNMEHPPSNNSSLAWKHKVSLARCLEELSLTTQHMMRV